MSDASIQQAINDAKAERSRPLRREKLRAELLRQVEIFACLYALEHTQNPNIEVRRHLEKLEATVFIKKSSIEVEMSRERVQQHRREVWQQMEVLIDLLAARNKDADATGKVVDG